jgi:hypothetical protein
VFFLLFGSVCFCGGGETRWGQSSSGDWVIYLR